jgi:hypothetical protein
MRIISTLALLGLLASYSSALHSSKAPADDGGQDEAEKLLRQAEELTDIRSSGNHAFRLAARVKLFEGKRQIREGTYDLYWRSPTDWRDQLRIDDFSQVRTAVADTLYLTRSATGLSLEVFNVLKLLDFPNLLRASPEQTARRLRNETRNGSPERTFEVAPPGLPASKTVFLDGSSPIPTGARYKGSHFEYKFENYAEFSGRQFPRTLTEVESNRPVIQVQVQELAEASIDASPFAIPQDALWQSWCPHPKLARPVFDGKEHPIPSPLRNGALEDPVVVYGVIGTDGRLHNLKIIKSASRGVDSYWLNEMRQARFYPASCEEVQIEQEFMRELYLR